MGFNIKFMLKQNFIEKWKYGEPVLNLYISIYYNEEFRNKFKELQTKQDQFWENIFQDIEKCHRVTDLIKGEKYVTNKGYLFPWNFHNLGDRIFAILDIEKNLRNLGYLDDMAKDRISYWGEKPMVELDVKNYRGKFHITIKNSKLWIPEFNSF